MQTIPLVVLLMALAAGSAHAYSLLGYKWSQSRVTMNLRLGSSTFSRPAIDGSTTWNAAARPALSTWNRQMQNMQFVVGSASRQRAALDGRNYAFFASSAYGQSLGSRTLAVALTWYSGRRAIDSDVVFNTRFRWNSYRGNLRSDVYDIRRVAIHEFGHVLGLAHSARSTAIMQPYITNRDRLGADDIAGAQRLYGAR
jgi:predicted Zn-dependent protease